jgi:hypothetical protein
MSLPTDFHREVAERAEPPGFDEVLARADLARRRRRTTVAAGAAAAVVVGATAFVLQGPLAADDRSPAPARPGLTDSWDGSPQVDARLPSAVRAVLDDDRLDLWAASGSSGAVAILWRGCDQEPCRFVVVTRAGDEVRGTALGASFPRLSPVPGGWLVEDATGTIRLTPTGDRTQMYVTGPGSADVMAGDTAVETADGVRLLRGDKVIPVPTPSGRPALSAYVTPEGRMVASTAAGDGILVAATDDGRSWDTGLSTHTGEPVTSAMVAGNGDHVAVVLLGDAPDGSVPVLEVQVSHDGGRTWTWVRGLDTEGGDRVRDLSALAVAASGTTYFTTGLHHLVRIDLDGDAVPTQLSAFDSSVVTYDGTVCVVAETGAIDRLECSQDDGTTWHSMTLPGFT